MGSFIKDLTPGSRICDAVFAISGVEHISSNSFQFIAFTLSDCTGKCKACLLEYSSAAYHSLCRAKLIQVQGEVQSEKKYRGQIKVSHFVVVEVPNDITPFVEPLRANHAEIKTRFLRLLETITEPNLQKLLQRIFHPDKELWADFCTAVAADKMHHSYRGGLLEHSLEVAESADALCKVFPALNRDLLLTGALLHDIGKLEEMEQGLDKGTYTASGILIGHVSSGAFLVQRYMYGIKEFPPLLIQSVTHMLLSHHGTLEYGAVRLPAFPEAQVLSECDMVSARLFQYAEAAASNAASLSVRLPGRTDGRAYLGDLGLEKSVPDTPPRVLERVFSTVHSNQSEHSFSTVRLPIMSVAAGSPDQSSEEIQDFREVILPAGGADHLFKVTGDSMIDAGIRDGDLLFVKKQEGMPKDREIVVANVQSHGNVVKRLRRDPAGNGEGRAWLDSENPSSEYKPILVDEETRIQGRVVGLLRDF